MGGLQGTRVPLLQPLDHSPCFGGANGCRGGRWLPMPAPCATGIGKYVALDLARRNARTILACRSQERGQVAVEEIRAATGNPAVLLRLLDTSSLASVRTFAQAVLREEKRLDVLVNNAGVTGMCQGQTFATNYLGPFLLTNLLLDLLKASAPARIVNVSSFRHSAGTADSRCLTGQERLSGFDATYNSTKLMNILFTAELAQRLQGTGVTANALSPGVVSTGIMRHFRGSQAPSSPAFAWQSAEQGAVSTIYCAVSEEVSGITGKYFSSDCWLALPSRAARDPGLARKLWEESERLTGLTDGRGELPQPQLCQCPEAQQSGVTAPEPAPQPLPKRESSHGAQPCQDCHRSGAQTMQSAWCNSFIKKPCAASADYSQMMSRSSCCFHTACRKLS
uniref:Retinol dehydrogenase 11 n=1 Tax=Falco tinnunculus TaxID=100819 RepID=A0A8C4V3G7_FALTI